MRCSHVLVFSLFSIVWLAACGSSHSSSSPSNPIFTSTPVTAAAEGVEYTYQISATDPSGGTVSFALTTFPPGASLGGNTVTWTPVASQSRVSNNFTVTATSSSGGSAQQSWTVSPSGTITVNWINTYWSPGGPVQVPQPASVAIDIQALVNEPDGSLGIEKASATAQPGVFTISNIPAGNYWLEAGGGAVWTGTGTFDAGTDIAAGQLPFTSTVNTTSFNLVVGGLQTEPTEEYVEFFTDPPFGSVEYGLVPDSTTLAGGFGDGGNFDWSQVQDGFFLQYDLETLGPLSNYVLGPEVSLSNLDLVNGATNTISATLNPATETSLNLSITGSQWNSAFNNIGPAAATVQDSVLTLTAEPYVTGGTNAVPITTFLPALVLVAPTPGGLGFLLGSFNPLASACGDFTGEPAAEVIPIEPPILTDQNLGALQYGDPFDPTWTRALAFCQQATVSIPLANSAPYNFVIVDGARVPPSANPALVPLALPVQSPTINGSSLFTPGTISTTAPTLTWSAPGGTAPYGYTVNAFIETTLAGAPAFEEIGAFSTSATSMTLPPLSGGNTYLFTITTQVDGVANMQTSPYRSALPTGFASVVSAPITIAGSQSEVQIHGDIDAWRRLLVPKRPSPARNSARILPRSSCLLSGAMASIACE